ncbi:NAD(P)/FAD-dependent oxidoreductase [Mycobacterium sp. E2497]|uniref:NAD(P)/FAD-dependent oxidoreductase n=1 Tax=Mycobacterium sp. E2497 TaxID=1834135 RepID=UPI000801F5B1|nr:FAD/NAD(P)-binding oxidoreductase [Mycobacterium sp. E2497]OBI19845.1 dehydrogenase [Mycobacterium sp. E2497]
MTQKLLVLGAGIGGLSVVKELSGFGVDRGDLDVTVVDEDFSHFLGFTLPWVMRGWRGRNSVPIRPSADALTGVRRVTGTVRAIDPATHTVTLTDGTGLGFDALVVATGARNAIERTPGLGEAVERGSAVHYYSADAASQAHQALREFAGGRLVFLVTSQPYRCPVAPYEGSLLAADLLRDNGSRSRTTISVYSPEKHPMPSAGPFAGPELVELLNDNGIAFFGEHTVDHIEADRKQIHFQDGDVVPFDLLVFIPPHEPAVTIDGQGWISVDPTTMQTQFPGIFAIGDATAINSPSGRPLPKAAIFAKNGARAAAANALHYLGRTDTEAALSGEGYCYVDTGSGESALGQGNFFTMPHPAIHLSAPSEKLHHDKRDEERAWRATWEHAASTTR